jgi:hypothetical protein
MYMHIAVVNTGKGVLLETLFSIATFVFSRNHGFKAECLCELQRTQEQGLDSGQYV